MKKIYITPALSTTEIAFCQPIATSGDLQKDGENFTGRLNDEDASGDGLIKGQTGVWDIDWSK